MKEMIKRKIKDKKGKTVIYAMGKDRKTLNPLAEAFMQFCKEAWGVEFVTVKAVPVEKGGPHSHVSSLKKLGTYPRFNRAKERGAIKITIKEKK